MSFRCQKIFRKNRTVNPDGVRTSEFWHWMLIEKWCRVLQYIWKIVSHPLIYLKSGVASFNTINIPSWYAEFTMFEILILDFWLVGQREVSSADGETDLGKIKYRPSDWWKFNFSYEAMTQRAKPCHQHVSTKGLFLNINLLQSLTPITLNCNFCIRRCGTPKLLRFTEANFGAIRRVQETFTGTQWNSQNYKAQAPSNLEGPRVDVNQGHCWPYCYINSVICLMFIDSSWFICEDGDLATSQAFQNIHIRITYNKEKKITLPV
jgi:hypothetical protein